MSSPSALAELLDRLALEGRIGVTETATGIAVHTLAAGEARDVWLATASLNWGARADDVAQTAVDSGQFDEDFGPFRIYIDKPEIPHTRSVVTAQGLRQALTASPISEGAVWWVARLARPFCTGLIAFRPWGEIDSAFLAEDARKSPREVVRDVSGMNFVPEDIRLWLLRKLPTADLWTEQRFVTFVATAAPALVRSLASEVSAASNVCFTGPPRRNLAMNDQKMVSTLGLSGFLSLLSAARWVYEEPRSTDQRHALFSAELARSASPNNDVAKTLAGSGQDILQGARFAYQLGMSDLGKDALKAQSDLRKAVADDTSKSADAARSAATGLATAIATGIGLFVARSSTGTSSGVLATIAAAVAAYLLVVGISSLRHLTIQRRLRREWRKRFYRFIPDEDYRKMVTEPVEQAEQVYGVIAWLCIYAAMTLAAFGVHLLLGVQAS